jgi:hypothetical protein
MAKKSKNLSEKLLRKEKAEGMAQGLLLGAGLSLAAVASYKLAKTAAKKYKDFKESPSHENLAEKVQEFKERVRHQETSQEEPESEDTLFDDTWDRPLYSIDLYNAEMEKALAEKPFCLDMNELHKIGKAWDEGKSFDIEYVNKNGYVTIRLIPEEYDDLDEEMPESQYLN